MERQERLSRQEVVDRLRTHERRFGGVSATSLHQHDRIVLRSLNLYFVGLDAARRATGVKAPPHKHTGAKRGPKPGTASKPRERVWNRQRVLAELRRLDRAGRSTRWDDLIEAGLVRLVQAATNYAGGLRAARAAAGIRRPTHRSTPRDTWTRERVLQVLRQRVRRKMTLAASRVQQRLYRAARFHFGSWPQALATIDVDARAAWASRKVQTKPELIRRLRRAARAGSDLRSTSLAHLVDLKAIRREFGTLANAITAARLDRHLARRSHGLQKWTREKVLDALRQRAARGDHQLTPGLYRAAQLYCGGTENARVAAGVPSPIDLAREARRHATGTEDRRVRRGLRKRE